MGSKVAVAPVISAGALLREPFKGLLEHRIAARVLEPSAKEKRRGLDTSCGGQVRLDDADLAVDQQDVEPDRLVVCGDPEAISLRLRQALPYTLQENLAIHLCECRQMALWGALLLLTCSDGVPVGS